MADSLKISEYSNKLDIPKYIYSGDKNAINSIKLALSSVGGSISAERPLVLLCIGTDRVTGDSLGPIVGYKLQNRLGANVHIYGTLENPVHAKNLSEKIKEIYLTHANPFIIAIDACLGTPSHIGYITVQRGSLRPGTGVKKKLPHVGDISITGIVNYYGESDYLILQNTRLNVVMKIADALTAGIHSFFSD